MWPNASSPYACGSATRGRRGEIFGAQGRGHEADDSPARTRAAGANRRLSVAPLARARLAYQ